MKLSIIAVLASVAALSVACPALAADLAPPPAATAVPEADVYDWTGVYVGANVQYTFGYTASSYVNQVGPFAGADINTSPSGFGGGFTLGFNQQLPAGIVLGIESDVDYGNVTDTIVDQAGNNNGGLHAGHTITGSVDWTGTLRGRIGYAAGNVLPYLTAGLAVANSHILATDGNLSDSAMLYGWTAGAGVEVALGSNWSAKAEVLYTDLGTHTYFANDVWASTSHPTSTAARFGVNYKF